MVAAHAPFSFWGPTPNPSPVPHERRGPSAARDPRVGRRETGDRGSGGWCGVRLPLAVRLQVAFPEVDVDALARLGGRAPELRPLEADGVHRLGLLALAVRVGV